MGSCIGIVYKLMDTIATFTYLLAAGVMLFTFSTISRLRSRKQDTKKGGG